MEPRLTRAQARAIERGDHGNVAGNKGTVTRDRKRKIKDPDLMEGHKKKSYRTSNCAKPNSNMREQVAPEQPLQRTFETPEREIVLPQHVREMDSSMLILLDVRSEISQSKISEYDTALDTIIAIQSTASCMNFLSYRPEARKFIPIMEHQEEIAKQKLESENIIAKLKAEVTELKVKVDEKAKENLELEKKSIDYAAARDYLKGRVVELERQPIKVLDSQSDALDCPMLELLAEENNPNEMLQLSQLQGLGPPTILSTNSESACSGSEGEMPSNEEMEMDDDITSSTRASGIPLPVTWSSISLDSQKEVRLTLRGYAFADIKITEKLEGPILVELMSGRMPPKKNLLESIIESQFSKYKAANGEGGFSLIELVNIHVKLAVEKNFPQISQYLASSNNLNSNWKEEIPKLGIVEVENSEGDMKFIATGFENYFLARWLAETLTTEDSWNKEFSMFFIKDVLETNFEYCSDTDYCKDWNNSDQELNCYMFYQEELCSLLDSILGEQKENNLGHRIDFTQVCGEADITAIGRACTHDELSHLLKLILNIGTFKGSGMSHLLFANSVISVAACKPNLDFFKIAKSLFKSDRWLNVDLKVKAMKKAADRGDLPMVEFLLNEMGMTEMVKEPNEKFDDLIHYLIENSRDFDDNDKLVERRKILQLLNSVNPYLKHKSSKTVNWGMWKGVEKESEGSPLLGFKVHYSLLTELIRLDADVNAVDDHSDTVLHRNAKDDEVFESLLNIIPEKDLKELVHVRGFRGDTPLISVVREDTLTRQILEKLLRVGADLNVRDSEGYSVIAVAIREVIDVSLVNLLIDLGACTSWRGKKHETLLHLACAVRAYGKRSELVSLILKNKIDPNCEDADGCTPLDYLFDNEQPSSRCDYTLTETAILLQNAGGKLKVKLNATDDAGQTILHRQVERRTCCLRKLFIEMELNVNEADNHGNTPLHLVLDCPQQVQIEKIEFLLNNKANPDAMNANGETPLHIGLKNRSLSPEAFQLLKSRTNVPSTEAFIVLQLEYVISKFIEYSTVDLKDLLLSLQLVQKHYYQYKNKDGDSLLHVATIYSNEAAVKLLVLEGLDINVRNIRQETSLHVAANFDDKDKTIGMAKCLIDNGADPGLTDAKDYTFLHLFILNNKNANPKQFDDLVKYLLSRDSLSLFNIHGGPNGSTPLQEAVKLLDLKTETIISLIFHGVHIKIVDKHGDSVLSYAVRGQKDDKFLTKLVKMGLDWKHLNFKGQNLLYIATQARNWKAVELLLKTGVVWRENDLKRARKFGWKQSQ